MKLLVNATCITSGKMTGIERFAYHIAKELLQIDHGTEVITSLPSKETPFFTTLYLMIAKRCLGSNEYLVRALWDQTFFRYRVKRSTPDLVFFPIQDGLFFPGVKQIVTVHDLHYLHFKQSVTECWDEIGWVRKSLYRLKMPHILKHSSAVIAVSDATKLDLTGTFDISPSKVHVVYNGYDAERFRIIKEPDAVLRRYGLLGGEYFLFVGSILRHKNLHRLVQAFAKVRGESKLVIVGICKDEAYLREVINAANSFGIMSRRLLYLEYVPDDDLPYLYNGAIAFVLPSLHEGFGVPLIEAMACGTPVITSNCSAMPEVAGGAALLVEPYSVDSIASAMRELLANSRRVEELRSAGLNRAMSFRWSYSAQKLYDVCKMVSES